LSDTPELFIDCRNQLGEGPMWHPERQQLFWFDVVAKELFAADVNGTILHNYTFDVPCSAAAVIDRDTLAVACAGAIIRLELDTGKKSVLTPLEADKPSNRSNDGRTNPAGGFWIGTMSGGGGERKGAGALYQYRAGRLEKILGDITVPNSTCFSPDGRRAYFTDGETHRIITCPIDPATGLPSGPWADFARVDDSTPDGSVVDSAGYLWNARWDGSAVVRHAPDGSIDRVVTLPVSRVTCPCFGGPDLRTLYLASASTGLTDEQRKAQPHAGSIFALRVDVPGQREPTLRV
jgi:sugar lactone lactonase YvrE